MRGPRARCRCILEDLYAVGNHQLLENDLEQSRIVHVVVRVFFAYGMHGHVKFTAIIGVGGRLDIVQQREPELWDTNVS